MIILPSSKKFIILGIPAEIRNVHVKLQAGFATVLWEAPPSIVKQPRRRRNFTIIVESNTSPYTGVFYANGTNYTIPSNSSSSVACFDYNVTIFATNAVGSGPTISTVLISEGICDTCDISYSM